jgi:hypothetical protein
MAFRIGIKTWPVMAKKYTIIVNLGSFEIQADTEEIDKDDINDIAYAADV